MPCSLRLQIFIQLSAPGLFPRCCSLPCSLPCACSHTRCILQVVFHEQQPALVQSTASVFRGHSGGMLLDEQVRFSVPSLSKRLLSASVVFQGVCFGLITSNAKHASGQIIPSLNFSIPSNVLLPLVNYARGFAGNFPSDIDSLF